MDYIKSPLNNKPIKRNGPAHQRLLKAGLIMVDNELILPVASSINGDAPSSTRPKKVDQDIKSSDSDVEQLVKSTSKNAMDVFKKIKSGHIALPDDLDDDEALSNYIQQCLMLNIIKDNKIDKPVKKPKKQYIVFRFGFGLMIGFMCFISTA